MRAPKIVFQRSTNRWFALTRYKETVIDGKPAYQPITSYDVTDQIEAIIKAVERRVKKGRAA